MIDEKPPDPAASGPRNDEPQGPNRPEAEEPRGVTSEDRVKVRRAPRYPRFIILGAGVGAIVTFVLTALFPVDQNVGFGALFGYFALVGVPVGAALGAVVAILLDATATRRATQLDAERTIVDPLPEELEGDLED